MSSVAATSAGKPPASVGSDPLPPVKLDPLAALLSYLIPGLGQVYQGRVAKGLMYFVCLYFLFFYGQWMGHWKNVWLPDAKHLPPTDISLGSLFTWQMKGLAKDLAYRPQFLGQFWIGIAAWPACIQYAAYQKHKPEGLPILGQYQRTPSEEELNALIRNHDNRVDLGWVFTVIAGVLNLLVIYDAFAGPMFRDPPRESKGSAPASAGAVAAEAGSASGNSPPATGLASPPAAMDSPPASSTERAKP